jgi:hypothetical protein
MWEHPPSNTKTSIVGPIGGGAGDLGAPTIQRENVHSGALGGGAGDLGAPTIQH